jgi:hypothetical protein
MKTKNKNRIVLIAISIFLMLSMSASMMLIPNASAHTPAWNIPTYAFINVSPNPIGVGQQATVVFWLDKTYADTVASNNYRFHNYVLTITKPDGATEKQTFATVQDTTSSQYTLYTPTQTGKYTFNFTFPGQAVNDYSHSPTSAYINDIYLPSSASTTLTVQQAPIPMYPTTPLPTEYWTRPIYGTNPNWYTISSNWLGSGSPGYSSLLTTNEFPADAVGPLTSHVMWTKPLQSGGVVGGNNFAIQGDTYFEGSAYLGRFSNPIILDGMLYYTEPISFAGVPSMFGSSEAYGPTDCVNLQTGQLIWSKQLIAPSFAIIYDYQDPNYKGVWPPILIATIGGGGLFSFGPMTWVGYDADTGDWLFNATNVPSGTSVTGPQGEYLIYNLANDGTPSNPEWYLAEWNSTKLGTGGPGKINSETVGGISGVIDASARSMYDWNISLPSLNTMTSPPTVVASFYNNMLLCYSGSLPSMGTIFASYSDSPYTFFAINLNASKGTVGSVLWSNTLNPPAGNLTVTFGSADPKSGVFVLGYQETIQFVGYSLNTGKQIWGPTPSQTAFDYYGAVFNFEQAPCLAYGNVYDSSYGGIVYCYNATTGNLEWTYGNGGEGNSTNSGFSTAYGRYPTFIYSIDNGVLYTLTTNHGPETPIFKGALARAINATDGAEIWTLSNFGSSRSYAMADGYATIFNGYDNQIYSVGRGPSATTVTAPNVGVTTATPITISGTVLDVSAGTQQTEQKGDFPYGVPVSSDASMTQWMGYVYQQQPEPTNFTGVQVQLAVLDSNGNHYPIGTATTNEYGTYRLTWTPTITGNYTIYATFVGTNGYWPSSADTYVYASAPAATTAPTATPLTGLASNTTVEYGIVAIIIVIAIIGAVLALLVTRKHP